MTGDQSLRRATPFAPALMLLRKWRFCFWIEVQNREQ